jgi:hypothetical protein
VSSPLLLYSGAFGAWLVDALRATGYDGQLDHVFARGAMVSGGARPARLLMIVSLVHGAFLMWAFYAWSTRSAPRSCSSSWSWERSVSSPRVQQAYVHAVVPSSERATVVSFASLLGSAGGIGGSLGLGFLARARSVATGYVTGGLMMLLALPSLLALRALRQPADVIVGRRAGTPAPCAGHGLPPIWSLDTTARQPEPTH